MIPFFVDIFTEPSDTPLLGRQIKAVGMGYPGDSNDLVVEVVTPEMYPGSEDTDRDMAYTFRNRVMKTGGNGVGRVRSPMLGVQLVGWDVRRNAWPRLAFELFKSRAPLYNFAAPLSRKYNDCDMADLKGIVSQGSCLQEGNDMDFTTFTSLLLGPSLAVEEYDLHKVRDWKAVMERRIDMIADIYGRYVDFSGKE